MAARGERVASKVAEQAAREWRGSGVGSACVH